MILIIPFLNTFKSDDSITREDAQIYRNEWTTILKKLGRYSYVSFD